jgi:DNA-binding NtrC family response regulator
MKLGERTAAILRAYDWPGNVRQLKNAIERMVVLASTKTLTPDLLPPEILQPTVSPALEVAALPLKEAMAEFQKRYLAQVLDSAGQNQTKAAEILGVQRSYLNRKLGELGLRPTSD